VPLPVLPIKERADFVLQQIYTQPGKAGIDD